MKKSSESIAKKVNLERIRYANCWEDTSVLVEALQPAPGKRILSINVAAAHTSRNFSAVQG